MAMTDVKNRASHKNWLSLSSDHDIRMKPSFYAVQALIKQHYGLNGTIQALAGEADYNYKIKTTQGESYAIKISKADTDLSLLQFQVDIMRYLKDSHFPINIPGVIPSLENHHIVLLKNNQRLRVQQWVPGRLLSEVNPRSNDILQNWGRACGLLSRHLQGFDHEAANRFYPWNPSEALHARKFVSYFQTVAEQKAAEYFLALFESDAYPLLPSLRKSINYNDAHEHNLLVNHELRLPQIIGVIDFGDALYTETINELAIACAYAGMGMADPVTAMAEVVRGYHAEFPCEENELAVLFPLIGARLIISVGHAAKNKRQNPENPYLQISTESAWQLIHQLMSISPEFVHHTFRQACGFGANPRRHIFNNWIHQEQGNLADVVKLKNNSILALDLSVGSAHLGNNSNFESIPNFHKRVNRLLEDQGADIAIGGYGEVRPIYTTDAYKVEGNHGAQWRTVHLGTDFWATSGSPVYAPLDGKVHSFKNNAADRDYGPTIILAHKINEELTFHTLYGHLSLTSLDGMRVGMNIKKGQQIAEIGPAPENGNWPPHLHFQILIDTFDKVGDFPGVAFPHEKEIWLSNCPNPQLFFSEVPDTKQPRSAAEIQLTRNEKLGRSLSVSYQSPLHIVRGFKEYLYDITGRRYLDTVNNVAHVGHEHPRVIKAMTSQANLLNTNTRYLHENIVKFSEALLATFPPELSVVHFVNSGSEANELALRMVEAHTGHKNMLAVEVGYHGNTGGCIGISSYKFDGKGGKGTPPHCHIVPMPDTFRGLYRDDLAATKYADHVEQQIESIHAQGEGVGGFICESIISCGGQIVLPDNYLKQAYQHVRTAGGLCIADEVQVGFGRVGDHFWGFELQGVVPDIVTLGKPIGNGHPLAAVVSSREVADSFANGMEYFNTFGGNPVSCAIGCEVLQIVKDENLQAHAQKMGSYLKDGLKELKTRHPIIGDVRGHGLFLGIELIKNTNTLEPAKDEADYLINRMRQRGILMSTDGPFHNVLKIKPPMCFSPKSADFLLENLEVVLGENFLTCH
jgi:4-aminobutyrate aminotransferase-like enzyme/Ser/Thr protein kinase RdoA (MazF antagonist)